MNHFAPQQATGKVFLVGAGPGDPDLLTVKALRCIQQADVVLFDRLVSQEIRALINPKARRFYVGKADGCHHVAQDRIQELLAHWALQGLNVCRLKGGDPFIFGRGAEELQFLNQFSIEFEVVPGVTAAAGCAAYAGIPLTHRDHVQACTFVTGHLKDGSCDLDWAALASAKQTLVFYMGLKNAAEIASQLMQHGLASSTPVAVIEQGTTKQQRVKQSTLCCLEQTIAQYQLKSPSLIVVGDVVQLQQSLHWFNPQSSYFQQSAA